MQHYFWYNKRIKIIISLIFSYYRFAKFTNPVRDVTDIRRIKLFKMSSLISLSEIKTKSLRGKLLITERSQVKSNYSPRTLVKRDYNPRTLQKSRNYNPRPWQKRATGEGAVKRDLRAIWSLYKMISYIMIFVHNVDGPLNKIDIYKCVHIDRIYHSF